AVAYAAINGLLIGGALLVLTPIFIITIITAANVTCVITMVVNMVLPRGVQVEETLSHIKTDGITNGEVFADGNESIYEDEKQLNCANKMKRLVFIDKLIDYFSRAKRVPGVVINEMIKLSPIHAIIFVCCVFLIKEW
ncbi:2501_t:CDS:2, partial [Cetraspora pellucida]